MTAILGRTASGVPIVVERELQCDDTLHVQIAADEQACPGCGHHVGLHDEDGCMLGTCDCTRPGED